MLSRSAFAFVCATAAVSSGSTAMPEAAPHELRVCADPNNLPFSNQQARGFENRIAQLIAHDLRMPLQYTWWSQRRGYIRNTVQAGKCDVVMGLLAKSQGVLTTRPYYRSTYAFVYRRDRGIHLHSLNDEALRTLKIGVHMVGEDLAPPAHILARAGIISNVSGYSLYGAYGEENPPAKIIDAVDRGEIDVAIVWGPLGGYFVRHRPQLEVVPLPPMHTFVPLAYDIAVGVRKSDPVLESKIDALLDRDRAAIEKILAEYGVPQVKG